MSQTKQATATESALLQAVTPRSNKMSSALIKKGITLQQIHGTKYAAEFLRENQIDVEVIMRVLLNLPEHRRHDDFIEHVPAWLGNAEYA